MRDELDEVPEDPPAANPFPWVLARASMTAAGFSVLGVFGMIVNLPAGIASGTIFGLAAIILGVMTHRRSSADPEARGGARLGIAFGALALFGVCFFSVLNTGVRRVREPAARSQSTNNLKQIGLATHSFHDAQNGGPADDEIKDKD